MRRRLAQDAKVRAAVKHWGADRAAESRYVLDISQILGAAHAAAMKVVEREHLSTLREDGMVTTPVPLVRQQTKYSCGAAATLAMLRRYKPAEFGHVTEQALYPRLGTTPANGTEPTAIARELESMLGMPVSLRTNVSVAEVQRSIDADRPVLVEIQAWRGPGAPPWSKDWADSHFAIVVGYDATRLQFMDPSTAGSYAWIPKDQFPSRWHDITAEGKAHHLAIVVGADLREDAPIAIGLGPAFRKKLATWQKPRVDDAFARLAASTAKKTSAAAQVYGIHASKVPGLAKVIETSRAANVKLITNATNDFLDQVQQTLAENEGQTAETIRDALQDRVGVSKSRGMVIAQDQSTKLSGSLNEHRQRAAGVLKFRWSTSQDERVRKSVEWSASDGREGQEAHAELDGEVFSWDDPPTLDDEVSTPGSPILCRCVAVPLLDDDDEEEESEEDEPMAADE
jgi:SPP1 gp7 family putative phage head morphogenesis protein